jgi:tripartite ATP-independent transporter DctP family solute receptor
MAVSAAISFADAREFRVADTQSEDYPTVQALMFMARLVEEGTGGRHRIRVFHSRQLGEEKETIEQTRVGAIDLNRTNVAPIGSLIPAANVLALPFLFRSFEHLHKVLDQSIGDEILAGSQRHGFVGLTFYDSGSRSIYNSVRPIRTLADMKGLRIRVQQSELMVAMIKALGAQPIELPYGQVSTGLSTRLIDGAENNWPSYVTTNHYKLAPYYTLTQHTMGRGKACRWKTGPSFGMRRASPAHTCAGCGPGWRSDRASRRGQQETRSSPISTARRSSRQ